MVLEYLPLATDTKFTLLAHSMGGFLAGKFAHQHADCLAALVLTSPAGLSTPPPAADVVPPAQLPAAMQMVDAAWHNNFTPGKHSSGYGTGGGVLYNT